MKFAKIIEMPDDMQVLVFAIYTEDGADVIISTTTEGVTFTNTLTFLDVNIAFNLVKSYNKHNAKAFLAAVKSLENEG